MTVLFQLVRDAVDYAGLFPPAALPIDEVVANYSKYLQSGEHSMLGRLIVPALSLAKFETAAQGLLPTANQSTPWRISALVPPIESKDDSLVAGKFEAAIAAIQLFNERHPGAVVDALEVKTRSIDVIQATIVRLPVGVSSFFEVPDLSAPQSLIEYISQVSAGKRVFAKIRTGGVTPDLIPTPSDVARFIACCAKHDVGFKATAGLHHPIRARYRLTYEDDAPQSHLFGFLNVFVAAMFAFEHGVSEDTIVEILTNEDASRFGFDEHQLTWDNLAVSSDRVDAIRQQGVISFGSCSFVEPTTELQRLPNVSHAAVFAG